MSCALTVSPTNVITRKDHYGLKWWEKQEPDLAGHVYAGLEKRYREFALD